MTESESPSSPLPVPTRRGVLRDASRTRNLVAAALVTALMAATGWVAIPLGAVPITLQVFCVVLAALLLPYRWAAASLAVYVTMGAIGVPVYAQGAAGLGVLLGPTGGYIWGFLMAAPLGAYLRELLEAREVEQVVCDSAAALVAVGVIYLLGWLQLSVVANLSLATAFLVGVLPFIVPDAVKAVVAVGVATAVRRSGSRG